MISFQNMPAGLSRKSTYLFRDIKHRLGIDGNFYKASRGNRIVIYHGICLQSPTRFNPIFLTLKTFEEHIKFYKKYFNVISLDDYYQQKFSINKFNIALTFDDGFANNYRYVLPILNACKIPATFFITAVTAAGYDVLWNDFLGIVGKYGPPDIIFKGQCYHKGRHHKYLSKEKGVSLQQELRLKGFSEKAEMMEALYPLAPFKTNKSTEDYWRQMTAEQIRELSASPFATIGSHGYYHNDMAQIGIAAAREELTLSKQYLEQVTSKPVKSFAFPYGAYNPQVAVAAKKAGYSQLLATDFLFPASHQDCSMRERFTINPFISPNNQMHAIITGKYER